MSWYSDKEKFNEFDPDYCERCNRGFSYEECEACSRLHENNSLKDDIEEEVN